MNSESSSSSPSLSLYYSSDYDYKDFDYEDFDLLLLILEDYYSDKFVLSILFEIDLYYPSYYNFIIWPIINYKMPYKRITSAKKSNNEE